MTTIQTETCNTPLLPSGNLRILVVDDGRNAADILAMFFEMEGHDVKVAYDGAMALSMVEEFLPQLVLMDLGMPVMDGVEATRRIRSLPVGKEIVIVALSGLDEADQKRNAAGAGFNRHLAKPVVPQDLRTLVSSFQE